jgi:Family of unknown function (DUF6314)
MADAATAIRHAARWRVEDLGEYLAGTWTVERALLDLSDRAQGHFFGSATFVGEARNLLVYREIGELTLGRHRGTAQRSYTYRLASASRALVYFSDGRYFHDLDLSSGASEAVHDCGDDRYTGRFVALGRDSLETRWEMHGPTQAYRLRTHFERVAPDH